MLEEYLRHCVYWIQKELVLPRFHGLLNSELLKKMAVGSQEFNSQIYLLNAYCNKHSMCRAMYDLKVRYYSYTRRDQLHMD